MNDEYDDHFESAGKFYNVDPRLLKTVFHIESGGNPKTKPSPAGALGGMQIMPGTARGLGVTDATNMEQAIPAAAKYLRQGLDAHKGDVAMALRYYNGGPDGHLKPATEDYVNRALKTYPTMTMRQAQAQVQKKEVDPDVVAGRKALKMFTDDPDVVKGRQAIDELDTPAAPPARKPSTDPDVVNGRKVLDAIPAAPPPREPNTTNPQTGTKDALYPELRDMLSTDPDAKYGAIIPMKIDAQGRRSLTMPTAMRDALGGGLDLAESMETHEVTPQATMALGNLMVGGGARVFGSPASKTAIIARTPAAEAAVARQGAKAGDIPPRPVVPPPVAESATPLIDPNLPAARSYTGDMPPVAADALGNYRAGPGTRIPEGGPPPNKLAGTPPDAAKPQMTRAEQLFGQTKPEPPPKGAKPDANPNSPGTNKFTEWLHGVMAERGSKMIGSGVGHLLGGPLGGVAGYMLTPIIKDVIANYGEGAGRAVMQSLQKRIDLSNLLDRTAALGRQSLPAFQGQVGVGDLLSGATSDDTDAAERRSPYGGSAGTAARRRNYLENQAPVYMREKQSDGKYRPIA